MKLTDRQIALLGVIVGTIAIIYGYSASKQNKEIIAHAKAIKDKVQA